MNVDNKVILENSKFLNVLYVEDDDILRDVTAKLFVNFFNSIDTAVDGAQGYEKYQKYYKENGEYYDIVLSDIKMPNMNGIEMSAKIKKLHFEQAIIFITAFNEVEYLHQAIELGVNGFLNKPIEMKQLKKVFYLTTQIVADKKLLKSYYCTIEDLNIQLQEKNDRLVKSTRIIETITHRDSMNKASPVKSDEIDYSSELEEFKSEDFNYIKEIYNEIDASLINVVNSIEGNSIDTESLDVVFSGFKNYISVISIYPFFNDLSKALNHLIVTIEHNELPADEETRKNIFMILESFVFVLGNFHQELSQSETDTINKLDASIINDINTVTNMWLNKEDEDIEAGEMEFF